VANVIWRFLDLRGQVQQIYVGGRRQPLLTVCFFAINLS
jgi:hypothetical protein